MKASASKLKGLDFKQLAIDHGEKAVLGLVGVFVLMVLWGAHWASYQEKTPEKLVEEVARASADLEQGTWPDNEKLAFATVKDLEADIVAMRSPVRLEQFTYGPGRPLFFQFYSEERKIREPDGVWLTVERPIADSLRILMATRSDERLPGQLAFGNRDDDEDEEADDAPEGFRPPGGRMRGSGFGGPEGFGYDGFPGGAPGPGAFPGGAGPMGPGGFPGGPGGPGGPGAFGPMGPGPMGQGARGSRGSARDRDRDRNRQRSGPGAADPGMGFPGMGPGAAMPGAMPGMYGGMGGMGSMGMSAEGRRMVAVRGVFHLRRQAERLFEAQGEPKGTNPLELVEIEDFEIQRQALVRGPDQFTEWETLDPATAIRLLMEEAADFDLDVVDPGITDAIITSPLPQRLHEFWGEDVSHPDVKNYHIATPEGRELQRLINERLAEIQKEREEERQPGGFGRVQYGGGNMRRGMGMGMMGMMGMMGNPMSGMAGPAGPAPAMGGPAGRSSGRSGPGMTGMAGMSGMSGYGMDSRAARQMAGTWLGEMGDVESELGFKVDEETLARQLQQTISAAAMMVLFRYLDFEVEPGHAYRYRIRLKLYNPNYDAPLDKVEVPSVAEGEFRWTPWSEPTPVVVVEPDAEYFIAGTRNATIPDSLQSPPEASMRVFQWLPDAGTISDATVNVLPGQRLGGVVETYVLRPAEPKYEKEKDIMLADDDVLVDIAEIPRRLGPGHEELELPASARGQLGLPQVALAVNEFGDLVTVDPVSRRQRLRRLEERQKAERYYYEEIKDRATARDSGLDGGGADELMRRGMMGMMGPAGGMPGMEQDDRRSRRGRRDNPLRRTDYYSP